MVYSLITLLMDIYVVHFFDMINNGIINVFVLLCSWNFLVILKSHICVPLSIGWYQSCWNLASLIGETMFIFLFFSYSWHSVLFCISFRYNTKYHSIVIRQWNNIQSSPLNNSCTHPTSYIVITMLLTIFSMLYFTPPWLFYNCQFVLNTSLHQSTHPTNTPPIWQRLVFCI